MQKDEAQIWKLLEAVKDPEIPVVSVIDLGLIRAVSIHDGQVDIQMTPTFSGCPAIAVMQADIVSRLNAAGFSQVNVELSRAPWSSDQIKLAARHKLAAFGIAPPAARQGAIDPASPEPVLCPYCGSTDTRLVNPFGSSLCRALYQCQACQQPFEQFKTL